MRHYRVFRQLEMNWPKELVDLFDVISVFNLNIDILSVDCFVEWSWTRKFRLANLVPLGEAVEKLNTC